MDPKEFITHAGSVVSRGAAGARSAVSRGYYGAFHFAAEVLDEFAVKPNDSSHGTLLRVLGAVENEDAQSAQSLLGDLQSDRVKADYRIRDGRFETIRFAQDGVEAASSIYELLESFRDACRANENELKNLKETFQRLKDAGVVT